MKRKLRLLLRRYQTALLSHLKQGRKASLETAQGLGNQALAAGLQTLELAKLHERVLITQVLPGHRNGKREAIIKQAGIFFGVAITPIESTSRDARETTVRLLHYVETLSQRTVELAASNLELSLEIAQRKAAEAALQKSKLHYSQLLEQSDCLQQQLRQLSRQILTAQEDERKEISRELHDVIAQTLTGINIRLAALKKESSLNTKSFDRSIARTQRLVEQSVNIVHQYARELRPAVLDDLGLIPALHSFLKSFTGRTGVRTRLTAFAGVEQLDTARRTVLYRVAQEALTNVARHAHASRVEVTIQKLPDGIGMRIADDGKSFLVDRILQRKGGKHLGLLGMRERVEMVGGRFAIESAPGKGTTISAEIPFSHGRRGEGENFAPRFKWETIMKNITVLLAEDHLIVREGFRKLLEVEADLEIVGEAQTGRQAVELARKLRPHVVVMDIAMPLLNGLEATRQIRKTFPEVRVIMLSAHSDDAYVEQAIALGAAGFLLKQTTAHDLSKAIREVHKGNTFFSPAVARRLDNRNQKSPDRNGLLTKKTVNLSTRESEVLQLIAEGQANKQVAAELVISIKTVEKHRQNLMSKLNIHDIAGLTRYAIGAGIIESSVQLTIV